MEVFLFLIFGLAGLVVVGWGIFAPVYLLWIVVPRLRRTIEELHQKIEEMQQFISKFSFPSSSSQPQQEITVSTPETVIAAQSTHTLLETPGVISATEPVQKSEEPPQVHLPEAITTPALVRSPPLVPSSSQADSVPVTTRKGISWEQFTGVNLFAWLGGLILFLAVIFLLKYSIENALLGPHLRVILGFLTGLTAIGGGVFFAGRNRSVTALTLCGSGILILYADIFAARVLHELMPIGVAFGLMVLVSIVAFFLAVRFSAQVVAVLGLVGAFMTPVLISSGSGNLVGLSGYIFILNVGVFAVIYRKRWDLLIFLAAVGTLLLDIAWMHKYFSSEKTLLFISVMGLGNIFFAIAAHLLLVKDEEKDQKGTFWIQLAPTFMSLGTLLWVGSYLTLSSSADNPFRLFVFLGLVNLSLLLPLLFRFKWGWVQAVTGIITFLLLVIWSIEKESYGIREHLYTVLGGFFGFTLLHAIYPLIVWRMRPQVSYPRFNRIFPVIGMLTLLIPMLSVPELSMMVWPIVALVMLVGVAVAVLTESVLTVCALFFVGFCSALWWMIDMKGRALMLAPDALLVIGGLGVLLLLGSLIFASSYLRVSAQKASDKAKPFFAHLPAFSGVFPFLLLIMLVFQLRPEDPSNVFGLALMLVFLMLGVGRYLAFELMYVVALLSTFLLFATWHGEVFEPEYAKLALSWYLLFYAVFTVTPFVTNARRSFSSLAWVASALAGPLIFILVYDIAKQAYPNPYMGLIPALFALPPFVILTYVLRQSPQLQLLSDPWYQSAQDSGEVVGTRTRRRILAWLAGVALFFITMITPVQFGKQWLTLGWALEAAALIWLYRRIPSRGLAWTGFALAVVAFVRLTMNAEIFDYYPRSETPIFNWYLYTYGLASMAMFMAGRWANEKEKPFGRFPASGFLMSFGTILLFVLMNLEIADYFSEGKEITFGFFGEFARGMTYAIAWAFFALGMVFVGMYRRVRLVRYAGMVLIGVTVLKLLLVDFSMLKGLYRVGASMAVALVLIFMSFLYSQFFDSKNHDSLENK